MDTWKCFPAVNKNYWSLQLRSAATSGSAENMQLGLHAQFKSRIEHKNIRSYKLKSRNTYVPSCSVMLHWGFTGTNLTHLFTLHPVPVFWLPALQLCFIIPFFPYWAIATQQILHFVSAYLRKHRQENFSKENFADIDFFEDYSHKAFFRHVCIIFSRQLC